MSRFKALSRRVAVAVPGIGLFIAVSLIDMDPLTTSFFALIAFLTAYEASGLLGSDSRLLSLTAAILTCGATISTSILTAELAIALLPVPGLFMSVIWILKDGVAGARSRTAGLLGLTVLVALCFGLMARMRTGFDTPWVMFIPLLICWLGDSFAYFAGSAFGRHKMVPSISPAKSWEGLAAGLAGSVTGAVLAGSAGAGFSLLSMVITGLAGGIAAVSGDLFESALKRDAGIKDSGLLLPGHGGLLDRFDSLLAVVPVVWVFLVLFLEWGLL